MIGWCPVPPTAAAAAAAAAIAIAIELLWNTDTNSSLDSTGVPPPTLLVFGIRHCDVG